MSERKASRVLLVGWDAADWQIIRPLIDQGRMPTLARLIQAGTSGNLATIRPILSPMLWNSIATGKRADKHGIHGFAEPTPDGQGVRPVTSTSRRCKAIWNILSQHDLSSIVVNWFASYPAEPIRGAVVSDRYAAASGIPPAQRNMLPGTFHPADLAEDLERLIVTPDMLDVATLTSFIPRAAMIDQTKDDRLAKLARLIAQMTTVHASACRLMSSREWDFAAVYYEGIDQFGHVFMPYRAPRMDGVSEQDALIYGEVIDRCYQLHDMMLATLLHHAGEDTLVMLVSDHGFHSDAARPSANGMHNPETWHRPFGIACMSGPGVKANETLYGATLLDVTPTILTAFGLPVGADMDGRPWVEAFVEPTTPEQIFSWDALVGNDGMHPPETRVDPLAEAEALRQLVDLGYMEPLSDDAQANVDRTVRDMKKNLALALSDSQRAARAIPLWEELSQTEGLDPDPFLMQIVRCHLKLGQLDACQATLDRLRPDTRSHPMVKLTQARIHLQRGESADAARLLQSLQSHTSTLPEVAIQLGHAHRQAVELEAAKTAYRRALELRSDSAEAMHGLALIALAQQRPQEAVDYALRVVALVHHYPQAHETLGRSLAAVGRTDQAVLALRTAVRMAPSLKLANRLLAELHTQADQNAGQAWQHELMGRTSGA
ncbi:alkaline phosphatase family protein [Phycisphaerales bacterium AB-hyl4]|uniref:Alkaline phosphatase family protein n=1 Tax=Natronomicrosphaera hydrolytica TaxID=3242702 RepID=A0ABV4UA00_9BACT